MKRLCFAILFLVSFASFAQKENDSISYAGKQEIKFNLAMAVAGIPELTYEYFLEDNSSVGLSLGVGLDQTVRFSVKILSDSLLPNFLWKETKRRIFY